MDPRDRWLLERCLALQEAAVAITDRVLARIEAKDPGGMTAADVRKVVSRLRAHDEKLKGIAADPNKP